MSTLFSFIGKKNLIFSRPKDFILPWAPNDPQLFSSLFLLAASPILKTVHAHLSQLFLTVPLILSQYSFSWTTTSSIKTCASWGS